jgi:hypothetical protein
LRLLRTLAAVAWALLASPPGAGAETGLHAPEYDLKATFLFHFTHFVEWPPAAYAAADSTFDLCVLSPDPFGDALRQVVAGERAGSHDLRVRDIDSAADAKGCQIVFVPRQRDARLVRDLPGASDGLILTAGESDDFLERGGMVRFELRNGRLRLLLSRSAVGHSQLRLSSKLLSLAHLE